MKTVLLKVPALGSIVPDFNLISFLVRREGKSYASEMVSIENFEISL
ncbi:MAG: hypothetical protein PT936_00220 [Treponema sp.]|nr:hypothetical protein [Treponema sp.]